MLNLKQIIFLQLKSPDRSGYESSTTETLLHDVDFTETKKIDQETEIHYTIEEEKEDDVFSHDILSAGFVRHKRVENEDDDTIEEYQETEEQIFIEKTCSEKLHDCAATYYAGFCIKKLHSQLHCEVCYKYMRTG